MKHTSENDKWPRWSVWGRAATLGLSVGLLQVVINQGDAWISNQITRGVVIKSILSPLVTLSVALVSAARTASILDNAHEQTKLQT